MIPVLLFNRGIVPTGCTYKNRTFVGLGKAVPGTVGFNFEVCCVSINRQGAPPPEPRAVYNVI